MPRKPKIVIECIKYTGDNIQEVMKYVGAYHAVCGQKVPYPSKNNLVVGAPCVTLMFDNQQSLCITAGSVLIKQEGEWTVAE